MEALAKANEVRFCQADLKQRIKDGRLTLDALLLQTADLGDEERDAIDRLLVLTLLESAHRVGTTRARNVLRVVEIGERRRVGSLTVRQRHALARELRWRIPTACSSPIT
jgi:hypothetical protein